MTINLLGWIIMMSIGLVFLLMAVLFRNADQKMLKRCTRRTKGTVIRFTHWENNGVHFPVVKYLVNNTAYQQTLKYGAVVRRSSSLNPVNSTLESDVNENTLVIKTNSRISRNPLAASFPVGTEMDVYYDPQKPKRSYVMRFRKSPCFLIFLCVGLFFALLAFVLLFLLPKIPI